MISTAPLVAGCASAISYPMVKSSNDRLESLFSSIPGRIGLVILTSIVSAIALLLLFWVNQIVEPFLLAAVVLTGIGIISGLASRWFLRRNTAALRLLAGLTALSFSLALVGVITNGAIGLSLTPKGLSNPDWRGLLQISWSGLITWLVLRAWRKPIRIKESQIKKAKSSPKQIIRPKVRVPTSNKKRPWQNLSKKIPRPVLRFPAIKKRKPVKFVPAKKSGHSNPKKLLLNRGKEAVKLVGREEHHCPYCLEIVEKGDPRGVKVCSRCKTWHHADCWAVTDACQVPHEH